MKNLASRRTRRIEIRVTPEERDLLEQAALLQTSGDLSRLITGVVMDAARAIVLESQVTEVTDEFRDAFYAAILDIEDRPGLAKLFDSPPPEGYEF